MSMRPSIDGLSVSAVSDYTHATDPASSANATTAVVTRCRRLRRRPQRSSLQEAPHRLPRWAAAAVGDATATNGTFRLGDAAIALNLVRVPPPSRRQLMPREAPPNGPSFLSTNDGVYERLWGHGVPTARINRVKAAL